MDTDTPRARKRSSSARPRMQAAAPGADYGGNTLDAKVVILGRQGVGKTSLVRRYTSNTFHPPSTQSTTGAFFVTKKCTVDGVGVRLQIWDTAGQERFRSMAPMYIRGANAAIVVYDLTSGQSFEDVRMWIDELKKSTPPSLLVYVVGSKSDLCPSHRAITPTHARASLLRWYPPPLPPPSALLPHTPPSRPSPPGKRQRLISLPSMPVSRSVPALRGMGMSAAGMGMSVSGPPTPGAQHHASRRPRLVSSPSSPTYANAHAHHSHSHSHSHTYHHTHTRPPARHRHNSSLAPPPSHSTHSTSHSNPNSVRPPPTKRPWSWASSPDEKDESSPSLHARATTANGNGNGHGNGYGEERGEYSSSEASGAYEGEVRSDGEFEGEVEEEGEDEEDVEGEEEEEGKGNWELFEVSAKDDIGIQSLFTHLIHSLLQHHERITSEHELRKRGSVMLRSDSAPASIVGGSGRGGGGARGEGSWGWGCCGI